MMSSVTPAATAFSTTPASRQTVPFTACLAVKPAIPSFRMQGDKTQAGDILMTPNQSQGSSDNQTNAPTFCQQHADTANELAHASRHIVMDQLRGWSELLPNLKDALPSVSQMASVWWRNGHSSSSNSKNITGIDASLPVSADESRAEAARAVVSDVAHHAFRFVL